MKKIDRRTFFKKSIKAGTTLAGLSLMPGLMTRGEATKTSKSDISVVEGMNYFNNTIKAIERVGGISRFVSPGDSVGLLPNTYADKPGTYTIPDVTLAVAYLCFEAGAKQVKLLKDEDEDYWDLSKISQKHKKLITSLRPDDDKTAHIKVKIPGAKIVKEAEILKGAMEYDRLINLPIIKNHSGVHMTCTLKNMMGISSFSTNIRFHLGENYIRKFVQELGNFFHDVNHFSQSLADLNKVRKVDLCVVDATNFITTNGPSGPGKIRTKHHVLAGVDRVAIDTLCCNYLDLKVSDIVMIQKAYENKLGEMDLTKFKIERIKA